MTTHVIVGIVASICGLACAIAATLVVFEEYSTPARLSPPFAQ